MKRGFPSSWFLKQSSPAGTAGNGDISGFELNKEGFGGCSGKVLVLSLGMLCPWCGLGKLLHCQSQDENAKCHWMTAVTGALEAGMLPRIVPALPQLWEIPQVQEQFKPCRAQSSGCSQPSRRVHFPPWPCWDISGDPGGQQEAALECKGKRDASQTGAVKTSSPSFHSPAEHIRHLHHLCVFPQGCFQSSSWRGRLHLKVLPGGD